MEMAQIIREYEEAQNAGMAGQFFGEVNYIIREAEKTNEKVNEKYKAYQTARDAYPFNSK